MHDFSACHIFAVQCPVAISLAEEDHGDNAAAHPHLSGSAAEGLGLSLEVLGFPYLFIGVDVEREPRARVCVGVDGRERIENEKWSGVCLGFWWRPRGEERV